MQDWPSLKSSLITRVIISRFYVDFLKKLQWALIVFQLQLGTPVNWQKVLKVQGASYWNGGNQMALKGSRIENFDESWYLRASGGFEQVWVSSISFWDFRNLCSLCSLIGLKQIPHPDDLIIPDTKMTNMSPFLSKK